MAQIHEADLIDISTPGLGQRCLYYAALLSLNKDATEETTRALKKQVHDKIGDFLKGEEHYQRNDLRRALKLTDPSTSLLATDEVIPALASVLRVSKIVVHEQGFTTEIAPLEPQSGKALHIGYVPGHFYGLQKNNNMWDHIAGAS